MTHPTTMSHQDHHAQLERRIAELEDKVRRLQLLLEQR